MIVSPRINGLVELMNRTLLSGSFRAAALTTRHKSNDPIQADLEVFFGYFNVQRIHWRCRLQGCVPIAAL